MSLFKEISEAMQSMHAESVELDEAVKYTHVLVNKDNRVVAGASDEKGIKQSLATAHLPPMSIKDKSTLKIVKLKKSANQKRFDRMMVRGLDEERAAWVPESIADEQVEAFMEAAIDAVSEGDESFVFEGKSYKVKGKKEGMDKVNPKALNKDFDDREDKDIDNDGDEDESDEYLHNRRKAVKKAMKDDDESIDESMSKLNSRQMKDYREIKALAKKDAKSALKKLSKLQNDWPMSAWDELDAWINRTYMRESIDEAAVKQPDSHNPPADTIKKQVGKGRTPEEDKLLKDHPVESEDENDGEKVAAKSVDNADGGSKKGPLRRGDRDVGAPKSPESLNKAIADAYAKVRAKK